MRGTDSPPTRGSSSGRGRPRPAATGPKGRTSAASGRSGIRPSGARGGGSGPHTDSATFRRRRLVALGVLLVLVVGAVLGVRALVGALLPSEDTLARSAASEAIPTDRAEPTGPPSDAELANPVDCRPSAVQLAVDLTNPNVATGATTQFPVTVTNAGQVPCLLDVGPGQLVVTISSGEDTVWTSADCPASTDARRILLDVGSQDRANVTWNGARSAAGCPAETPIAGAGTYRVVVTLVSVATETDPAVTIATVEQPFTVV